MVSFKYLVALALGATPLASPTPLELDARAGQTYTCRKGEKNDGTLIGKVSQDKSIGYFREAKTTAGKSGYPMRFYNNEELAFGSGCRDKNAEIWELPVLDGGKRYDYQKSKKELNPGRMRVYYTKDLTFCGIGTKSNDDNSGPVHSCKI
ncbi:Ribonuclease/ribotoxin [Aspergillus avenaceus]|uniref:Ribonuclease/ribotoxin n=1 Tax=Aspergillus avenaceus TaxID=36643 RepID=A0A5N6U9E5_ASPAV|nr:Ribonuclease/ribotoxin [Aspergillus avenaceus]